MKLISKYKSPNYNKRNKGGTPKFIIIHYTALKSEIESIKYLCDENNRVSCHYLVSKSGKIFNIVSTEFRAWHAGYAKWKNYKDLNSYSIGIELDNPGYSIKIEKFQERQIQSLIKLISFLKKKYQIKNENILGHSDIAPYRKIDPGEKFPWQKLEKLGLSYFPKDIDKITKQNIEKKLKLKSLKTKKLRALYILSKIGYDTLLAYSNNRDFKKLITIYQMHFNNKNLTGKLDNSTYSIILSHFNDFLTKK